MNTLACKQTWLYLLYVSISSWQVSACLGRLFPTHRWVIRCSDCKIAYFTGASITDMESDYK